MEFKNYKDYLLSNKWDQIKEDFREFSNFPTNVCFLCYSKESLQLHHWRYPNEWSRDSYKNTIPLCEACHETAHSIENSKDLHNSHFFNSNSTENLVRYLSFIIKSTDTMKYANIERISNEF